MADQRTNGAAEEPLPGTAEDRVLPGYKRAIRDVYAPDAAGDERMDGLLEQLRRLDWPKSGAVEAAPPSTPPSGAS